MSEVDVFFEKLGWRKLDHAASLPVYVNDYAAIGFAAVATADEIAEAWPRWQADLFQLRKQPEVGDRKDLYLMTVLRNEDPQVLMRLQSIVDDTHVCRKIILLQRGRTVTETLMEEPLIQVVGATDINDDAPAQLAELPLDKQVIADLAKKSASRIFDHLLARDYRRTDET